MSNSSHGSEDYTVRQRLEAAASGASHSPELDCLVVRYRTKPDRCTITPRECPEEKQLTSWLSVDLSVVVDLEDVR